MDLWLKTTRSIQSSFATPRLLRHIMPESIGESNYDGEITCRLTLPWRRNLLRLLKVTFSPPNQRDTFKGCLGLPDIWGELALFIPDEPERWSGGKDLQLPATEGRIYTFVDDETICGEWSFFWLTEMSWWRLRTTIQKATWLTATRFLQN